jgi:uncharacterized protein (DUF1697 family)
MTVYVALLRAVNVGGSGLLPIEELRALCLEIGFSNVRSYIQSGNVVFDSGASEAAVGTALEEALAKKTGRPVGVLIRTAPELRAVLDANPFRDADPAQVGVIFLPKPVTSDTVAGLVIPGNEEVRALGREIFVHYQDGMGRSKLKLRFAADGTTRNLNTVVRLLAMASGVA